MLRGDSATVQSILNCFSWQTFIALDWPADPQAPGVADPSVLASGFGEPGDTTPTVWETYSTAPSVFRDRAADPLPFGQSAPPPEECPTAAGSDPAKVLAESSKFSRSGHVAELAGRLDGDIGFEFLEASGQGLADQNGQPVYFERSINRDEYDYIISNRLFDAAAQHQVAANVGIDLPSGTLDGAVGAIETKASWRVLPAGADVSRFKTSTAYVVDPASGNCTGPHTIALVGLHIVHKTQSNANFVWTTFEHVDNAPTEGVDTPPPPDGWSFYDPDCAEPCTPSWEQPPEPGVVVTTPVQIERRLGVADSIASLNDTVHDAIRSANANSVWQYYQQIDTLWDQSPPPAPGKGATISLPFQPTSERGTVFNSTLETYSQFTTCSGCHTKAAVAATRDDPEPTLASDYSFLFSSACESGVACRSDD